MKYVIPIMLFGFVLMITAQIIKTEKTNDTAEWCKAPGVFLVMTTRGYVCAKLDLVTPASQPDHSHEAERSAKAL